jgi:peptidyl-prolyl cis-trans isomerase A (cyclophilin A)
MRTGTIREVRPMGVPSKETPIMRWQSILCVMVCVGGTAAACARGQTPDRPALAKTFEPQIVETAKGPLVDDPESDDCYEYVAVTTAMGDIILELHLCASPRTVENFLQYVDDGFYDDTLIHRVEKGFVIQGGAYDPELKEKTARAPIANEWPNGLKNLRGTIAMARGEMPDSATSQFFINLRASPNLDRPTRGGAGHAVFGRVVEGMDVVDRISIVQTIRKPEFGDIQAPIEPVLVLQAGRVPADEAAQLADKHRATRLEMAGAALRERYEIRWRAEMREKNKTMTEEQRFEQALEYIAGAGWDTTKGVRLPSGVWYIDDERGVGDPPGPKDFVSMQWDGWLTWGEKFGSWEDYGGKVLRGEVSQFVPGYQEALLTMKPGGERIVYIPSHLAYGEIGREPKIPANGGLIYRIRLLGVLPATEEIPVAPQPPPPPQPGAG